jgi:hypothetical protein
MKLQKILLLVTSFGLIAPLSVGAATFLTSEEEVSIPEALTDDLYIAGNGVSIDKDVSDDVFAGGQSVKIDANIGQDVFAGGNSVRITGTVGDDVFAGGEIVEINVASVDDVFAGGNRVEISKDTVVNGDVFAGGQTVTIAGNVKGNVKIGGDTMIIKSGAVIEGALDTYGEKEPRIEAGATISGERKHHVKVAAAVKNKTSVSWWVTSVLTWFVVGLVLIYLVPQLTNKVTETALKSSGKSLLIGAVWALLFLPVVILLMITVVGIPLAFILLLLTIVFFMLAIAYAMILIGVWTMKKISKTESEKVSWQHVLLGVVIYKVITLIPIIGWLVGFILVLLSLGALIWTDLKLFKGPKASDTKPVVV